MTKFAYGFLTCCFLVSLAANYHLSQHQTVTCEIGYTAEQQAAMDALMGGVK